MSDIDHLTADLPDVESARRFLESLEEQHPRDAAKLRKNAGLLSDVLTLASYSPLLSTTLLQNPEYIWWLNRKRQDPGVRNKDELLEALGRFMLTHSQLDLHTQLARFRRRELLRIFLSDIRRLATIAEVTEDISNLADAILETALRTARQEMDNRTGGPQAVDEKGKKTAAEFCIVSLGKLGSFELNYSSDIDLLFLYSAEGETSGRGTRGSVSNREYFVKLGETVTRLVGRQAGEGAAYRIDMRLRPHGRVGPLAISVADAVRYYTSEARDWERQVLIRSHASAGDPGVYQEFFAQVEDTVYRTDYPDVDRRPVEDPRSAIRDGRSAGSAAIAALDSVRRSKQLIDVEQKLQRGFNVKLGRGGIREIEFIAQALQLAYGGIDRWLRAPHTLISLSRLADRGLITDPELTELFNAYDFLRRLEHILQMEHGLQVHTVPDDPHRRELVARRMRSGDVPAFDDLLKSHLRDVHRVFTRVFDPATTQETEAKDSGPNERGLPELSEAEASRSVSDLGYGSSDAQRADVKIRDPKSEIPNQMSFGFESYREVLSSVLAEPDFRHRLAAFRQQWRILRDQILDADKRRDIGIRAAKQAQTALAEASIEVALEITKQELARRYRTTIDTLQLAVLGLGKLGGCAVDYESDLDLVLVYDEAAELPVSATAGEFYARAAEIFVTTLSSMTRDGSIYRVDLRLRPYGKNGTSAISATAFRDYIRDKAVAWEWLAYVRIRGVGGDIDLARRVEKEIREIIYRRAAEVDRADLAAEARRMRTLLEKERAGRVRGKEVDIKYGPGGMLDIYFAVRYLQLRDGIPDSTEDRSTEHMLGILRHLGSLSQNEYEAMLEGYRYLSALDHELRVAVGRTTRLPLGKVSALEEVARRMDLESLDDLVERLALHRLNIRSAYDSVTG